MGRIFLCRHGHPDWGGEPRYTGTTDTPLSDLGRRQADRLGERLSTERLDAVYSTGLRRTDDTAAAIARQHGLSPAVVADLSEVSFGEWEGLTRREIEARWPEVFAARQRDAFHVRCPGGENYDDLAARALPAFRRLAGEHGDHAIAIVAHQATNRTILADVLGLVPARIRSIAQLPAALNVIDNREHGLVVVTVNDTCHLDGLEG